MSFHLKLLPEYVAKERPMPKPVLTGNQIVKIIRAKPRPVIIRR